jgi:hypothetical protein
MSLYQLQKLIYQVNRDPSQRERYRQDPAEFVKGYELTEEEKNAALNVDVENSTLSGFILYCFGPSPCYTKFPTRITPRLWQDWSKPCRSFLPAPRVMLRA